MTHGRTGSDGADANTKEVLEYSLSGGTWRVNSLYPDHLPVMENMAIVMHPDGTCAFGFGGQDTGVCAAVWRSVASRQQSGH